MISAVLFDIGGVVMSSPFEAFNRYEERAGLPRDLVRRVNATNPDTNAWAHFERNQIDRDEFCLRFEIEALSLGHHVDAGEVLAGLAGVVRPAMVEAVRRCAERLKTAALTNNFAMNGDVPVGPSPLDDVYPLFDVVVESRLVGWRKPDPRFYEHALELLQVDASVCVFLDDLGVNLKPARAMGMTTIKVLDPHQALAELQEVVGFELG